MAQDPEILLRLVYFKRGKKGDAVCRVDALLGLPERGFRPEPGHYWVVEAHPIPGRRPDRGPLYRLRGLLNLSKASEEEILAFAGEMRPRLKNLAHEVGKGLMIDLWYRFGGPVMFYDHQRALAPKAKLLYEALGKEEI